MNKTLTIKTKLSLKLFLVFGLTFGILILFINCLFGDKTKLITLVLESIIFGSIMSLFFTALHLNTLNSNGITELDEKCFKVKQVDVIHKSCSISQLSQLLKQDNKTHKWKQTVSGTTIKIKTKISPQSWGEIILISILENQVKIESRPILITTIFDSGKNLINIKKIKDIIEQSNN